MNNISKNPLSTLGYGFIAKEFIPKGKNEYYLRNIQHRSGKKYRHLKPTEIRILQRNANSSDDWSKLMVSDRFDPALVKNCSFFGLVRIGNLEACFREFNNLRMPVGLYNSTIISCDIGDNVVISNVNFMSHYIICNDVMLVNIEEIATTNHSKFGNGVLKQGERESVRVWMELCNENAGRSVLPFNGMLAADAWLWSKYRDDQKLLDRFRAFTDLKFDTHRGYYGKIGDRSVVKNCSIIKDVWIGSDAYIKGANKLKNLTINSSPEAKSQIGEGCELVNGIVGYGCRIFYGVKAVRFMMGSNSQLKYGARLINSYLGDNSTISCCEVLNSLIFASHEQHHNNSFLCAATVMGQSNMAAGATIGSNHNSRGADGEIVAGRGFWPALCVSLKHNSKFASFTLIAKGDFPAELNIPIPFSLVSNDVSRDRLVVMPGYWLRYNLYALARNVGKYISRDKRLEKTLHIEYDFLGPDSVNEIMDALPVIYTAIGNAVRQSVGPKSANSALARGKAWVDHAGTELEQLEVRVEGFENSHRPVILAKAAEGVRAFREMIRYNAAMQLIEMAGQKKWKSFDVIKQRIPFSIPRVQWRNVGGQLMPAAAVESLKKNIRSGKIASWDDVHAFYRKKGNEYATEKYLHAWASLIEMEGLKKSRLTKRYLQTLVRDAVQTRAQMVAHIYQSRAKDYQNPFRTMVYDSPEEMNEVIGRLEDNGFIREQEEQLDRFRERAADFIEKYC